MGLFANLLNKNGSEPTKKSLFSSLSAPQAPVTPTPVAPVAPVPSKQGVFAEISSFLKGLGAPKAPVTQQRGVFNQQQKQVSPESIIGNMTPAGKSITPKTPETILAGIKPAGKSQVPPTQEFIQEPAQTPKFDLKTIGREVYDLEKDILGETSKKLFSIGTPDKLISPAIDKTVNYIAGKITSIPVVGEALKSIIQRSSGTGIVSSIESIQPDRTFREAYDAIRQKQAGDPSKLNQFLYQLGDVAPQTAIGVALNFVPFGGKALSTAYWTALSAGGQVEESGKVTSVENVLTDVALDPILGTSIQSLLKKPAKTLLETAVKSFGIEGGTEVAQDLIKFANNYQDAQTDQERQAILEDFKNYFKSGQILMTAGVSGLSGSATGVGAYALNKSKDLPNKEGGFIKFGGENKDLKEEAKKYKSAEEFVKNIGTPVYHGTNAEFKDFDPKKIGSRDSGWFGKGFYFTQSKGEAGYYGKNIKEAYLELKKPFDFSSYENPDFKGYGFSDGQTLSNLAKVVPEINTKLKIKIADEIPTAENDYKRFIREVPFGEYDQMVKKENLAKDSKFTTDEKGVQYYSYKDIYGREKDFRFSNTNKKIPEDLLNYVLFNEKYSVDTGTNYLYGVQKEIADNLGDSFTETLKKNGYDGAIQSPEGDEYVAFYPEQIKTKSQLEQIWKEANTTNNLQTEAKKYKTPEEFTKAQLDKNSITTEEPITVYRGEGKGIGNSTLVNGRYFAGDRKFAEVFGDVTESTIPKGTKIFDLDSIKYGSDIVSDTSLVDTTKLTDFLMDNGYEYTKNTNSRGVEYVKLARTAESEQDRAKIDFFKRWDSKYRDLADKYNTFNAFFNSATKRADDVFEKTGEYTAVNVKMAKEYWNMVKNNDIPTSKLKREDTLQKIWEGAKTPIEAFKRYSPILDRLLFDGQKATQQELVDIITKDLKNMPVSIEFTDALIPRILENGETAYATGMYRGTRPELKTILKPIIELYINPKSGKAPIKTALHEAGHYMFDLMTNEQKAKALEDGRKRIKVTEKLMYKFLNYETNDKIVEEFLADEYAKAKMQANGYYRNPLERVFKMFDRLLQAIVDKFKMVQQIAKKVYDFHKDERGFIKISNEKYEKLPKDLQNKIDEVSKQGLAIEIKQNILESSPNKRLEKYMATRGEFEGKLPEIKAGAKSQFGKRGDKIIDSAYDYAVDPEVAREDFEKYQEQKKELKALKQELVVKEIEIRQSIKEFDAKQISERVSKKAEKKTKVESIEELNKRDQNALNKMLNKQEVLLSQKKEQKIEQLDTTQGEGRSLEIESERILSKVDDKYIDEVLPLPLIIQNTVTPLKNKVAWYDYFRTPNRVLKKIGLGKEATQMRDAYEEYTKELPKNIDKITAWSKGMTKENNVRIFRYLDGEAITLSAQEQKVADEIKTWLSDWATRLKLPQDNKISHYITHIFDKEVFGQEFDEDLAKIITDKIPSEVYDPFLEKRLGAKGYIKDTWQALDAYVKRATRKVHIDPVLENITAKTQTTADMSPLELSQFNYVQSYINQINMRPTNLDTLIDNSVKQMFGYRFGQRPVTYLTKLLRRIAFRGTLGLNLGSALRNLSQGINTYAKLGEKYTAIGYLKLLNKNSYNELKSEGVLEDSFIQDRQYNATKKAIEKFDKVLFSFFKTAEMINRGSAYFGAKSKAINKLGMTEEQAVKYAKKLVADTQFKFDAVDQPVVLGTDIVKTLLQYQTYTVKQMEFLGEMVKNKEFAGLLRYALAGLLFMATIGRLFGMKPDELIPTFRTDTPVSFKFPWEVTKAVFGAPDKFGQPRDWSEKLSDIAKTFVAMVPAGGQIKKTIEGIMSVQEGGSFDKAGKLQFRQGQSAGEKVQSVLFGKYASDEAKDYFNKQDEKYDNIKPVYKNIKKLLEDGKTEEANTEYNKLSKEGKELYKEYATKEKTKATIKGKKDILNDYLEIRKLLLDGKTDEADTKFKALKPNEKKYFKLVAEDFKRDEKAKKAQEPVYKDGEIQTETSLVNTVMTYAKAMGTDPITAFDRIFTGQKIRRVDNGVIVVERMTKEDSQAVKEEQNAKNKFQKLDHTIPLQLGGSNEKDNLKIVPSEVWKSYTPVENFLGKQLRNGKLNKKQVQETIKAFKEGRMTSDEIINEGKTVSFKEGAIESLNKILGVKTAEASEMSKKSEYQVKNIQFSENKIPYFKLDGKVVPIDQIEVPKAKIKPIKKLTIEDPRKGFSRVITDPKKLAVANKIKSITDAIAPQYTNYLLRLAEYEGTLDDKIIVKNKNGTTDKGVFQINDKAFPQITEEQATDLEFATLWAISLIKAGKQKKWLANENVKKAKLKIE